MLETPSNGKNTRGINAVIAMGTASVAHQTAIQTNTAAAFLPSSGSDSISVSMRIIIAEINPTKNQTIIFPISKVL